MLVTFSRIFLDEMSAYAQSRHLIFGMVKDIPVSFTAQKPNYLFVGGQFI